MGRADQVEERARSLLTSSRRWRRGRPETAERWRKEYLERPDVIAGLRRIRRAAASQRNAEIQLVVVVATTAQLLRSLRLLSNENARLQFVRYATGLGALFYRENPNERPVHAMRRARIIARVAAELELRIASRRLREPAVRTLITNTCQQAGVQVNRMLDRQSPLAINVAIDALVVWALGKSSSPLPSNETLSGFHNEVSSLLSQ